MYRAFSSKNLWALHKYRKLSSSHALSKHLRPCLPTSFVVHHEASGFFVPRKYAKEMGLSNETRRRGPDPPIIQPSNALPPLHITGFNQFTSAACHLYVTYLVQSLGVATFLTIYLGGFSLPLFSILWPGFWPYGVAGLSHSSQLSSVLTKSIGQNRELLTIGWMGPKHQSAPWNPCVPNL